MGSVFGSDSKSSTKTSTVNMPFAVQDQGIALNVGARGRYNADNITTRLSVANGGTLVQQALPEGFFEFLGSIFRNPEGAGDNGLDQVADDRLDARINAQIAAGGERAVSEIKTGSSENIVKTVLWGMAILAAVAVGKMIFGGSK